MKRFLLIAVLLCVTVSGFAKREKIHLDDQLRSPMPPIEVYINDRTLEFGISENFETLDILIEDVSGEVVFNSIIAGDNGIIPLVLDLKKGSYVLVITCKEHILWGDFSVE